jgi:hypothetical protein
MNIDAAVAELSATVFFLLLAYVIVIARHLSQFANIVVLIGYMKSLNINSDIYMNRSGGWRFPLVATLLYGEKTLNCK